MPARARWTFLLAFRPVKTKATGSRVPVLSLTLIIQAKSSRARGNLCGCREVDVMVVPVVGRLPITVSEGGAICESYFQLEHFSPLRPLPFGSRGRRWPGRWGWLYMFITITATTTIIITGITTTATTITAKE